MLFGYGPGQCRHLQPQPALERRNSGQGQTIALTEDNNVYTTGTAETTDSDLTTYRSTFGLSGYTSFSFSTVHPGGCTDPGTGADDGEAAIDVEMATAVAPSAKIELISCATSGVTEGTIIAEANLVNGSAPYPGVISQSYGICENYTGAAGEAFFYNTFQQAAAQGISVFVSSGDYLSGGCANLHSDPNITSTAWASPGGVKRPITSRSVEPISKIRSIPRRRI